MNHEETRQLLDAYLDGELDLIRSLEVEKHLSECPDCSIIYRNRQVLREGLAAEPMYFRPPPDLRRRIQRSLHEPRSFSMPRWATLAAALIVVVAAVGLVGRNVGNPSSSDQLVNEVLASHLRSLMGDHLEDVVSTDQHTVKPWFDGKLDFSPPVFDLASVGFPLIGGRLDYVNNRPVAALIYQRNKHVINLFIWPASQGDSTLDTARQGYQVDHWTQGGMTYWAISDVNSNDLTEFVKQFQAAVPAPDGP